ncbi:unnamed protein product [Effrenium voratum]|uniref:Tex-like protein N-terminal domain-containing protein n=1 Tax=Effrenium voratum TaxID=2562239 RepID=A0AA36JFH4_9DINO|nr:unnamed protein product [Effrenium voratum]
MSPSSPFRCEAEEKATSLVAKALRRGAKSKAKAKPAARPTEAFGVPAECATTSALCKDELKEDLANANLSEIASSLLWLRRTLQRAAEPKQTSQDGEQKPAQGLREVCVGKTGPPARTAKAKTKVRARATRAAPKAKAKRRFRFARRSMGAPFGQSKRPRAQAVNPTDPAKHAKTTTAEMDSESATPNVSEAQKLLGGPSLVAQDLAGWVARQVGLDSSHVGGAVRLFQDGATLPFIARYRKEQTGAMGEEALRRVERELARATDLERRRGRVAAALHRGQNLTPSLQETLLQAETMEDIDAVWAPCKAKKSCAQGMGEDPGKPSVHVNPALQSFGTRSELDEIYTSLQGCSALVDMLVSFGDATPPLARSEPSALHRQAESVWTSALLPGQKVLPAEHAAYALEGLAEQFGLKVELEGAHLDAVKQRAYSFAGGHDGMTLEQFEKLCGLLRMVGVSLL